MLPVFWRVLYSHGDPLGSTWPMHMLVDVVESTHFPMDIGARGVFISLPLTIYPMVGDIPKMLYRIPIWPDIPIDRPAPPTI